MLEKEENKQKFLIAEHIPIDFLAKFFNHIRSMEILDTVRHCAFLDYSSNRIVFYFHKQALFSGKLAVITQDTSSPLGNIELHLEHFDPERILDWIAPQTSEGKELRKTSFNEIKQF